MEEDCVEAMFSKLLRISQVEEICAYLHASLSGLILDFDVLFIFACACLCSSFYL